MKNTYPEGEEVRINDVIWMDEGNTVRRVIRIGYDVSDPPELGVFCSSDILGKDDNIVVHYPFSYFEQDGIGLVEKHTLSLLKSLISFLYKELNIHMQKTRALCAVTYDYIEEDSDYFWVLDIYNLGRSSPEGHLEGYYIWDHHKYIFRKIMK